MRKVDIGAGVLLLVLVAVMVFWVIPNESGDGVWHGLSPYFYPAVMLAGIALSSVGLLVQAFTRPGSYDDQPKTPISRSELGFFLLAFVLIFAAVLVLHQFGTWVGGTVLIAAMMVFMGCLNPLKILAVAIPTLVLNYALVTWVLEIPMP